MKNWKIVLNQYIKDLNQMEIENSIDSLRSYVMDQSYLVMQGQRLARLHHSRLNSKQQVKHSETSARLVKIHEQERLIIADIQMRRKWTYDSNIHSEQVLHERLQFVYRGRAWVIAKVELLQSERNSRVGSFEAPRLSQPYMNQAVLSNRTIGSRTIRYNRQLAVDYANEYWDKANPQYEHFAVDCTNFVSQCLFAGGIPMNYTGTRGTGWWYEGYDHGRERWSFSWAVANSLQLYMLSSRAGLRAQSVDSARKLLLGDIISYDWDGDSAFQHSTIVTGYDKDGEPLVNAHTNDSRSRFWHYRDSYAWSDRTRYTFLHIPDIL